MIDRVTPYLRHRAKLRLERPVFWDHHRGGWRDVVNVLHQRLSAPDGTSPSVHRRSAGRVVTMRRSMWLPRWCMVLR